MKKVVYCNFNYKCSPPTAEFKGRKGFSSSEKKRRRRNEKKKLYYYGNGRLIRYDIGE